MGDGGDYKRPIYYMTRKQAERIGITSDSSNTTRTIIGGMERITYKEVVNGVTIIRTKWRQKKKRTKIRRS